MTQPYLSVKDIEPLINVRLLNAALLRTKERPGHLPGIVGCFGPPGWGKTCAATLIANTHDCAHIELKSYWNRKTFFEALCLELGIQLKRATIGAMGQAISQHLGRTRQPLIIDEVDIAIQKGFVDDIRAIFEDSRTVVIIIGEETLPQDLLRWERFHSRVLEWVPAEPPALADTSALVKRFCREGISIADDLTLELHTQSGKSVRRICVNIERVQEFARENGLEIVDLAIWNAQTEKTFYTGDVSRISSAPQPPRRRR
ncbi:MAG: ATP-binding protein [Geobacteraceae bacterium]|nr:ATP-binding protein [Geobacteraceae bacterium]